MLKILCPTDFSEISNNAIAYAAKFAKNADGDLTLFYVESMHEETNKEILRGKSMTLEAETERLEEICREVSAVFSISCYSEIQPSNDSLSKVISAKAEDFDLIIMGTNGADDFYKNFTGSNTYKVIKSTSVPVLYIPPGYHYSPVNAIVYAFDYLHDYKLPIEQLRLLIDKFKCKLTVLLVTGHLDWNKEYELKEIQRQIKNVYWDEISMDFETIQEDKIAESIEKFVQENDVDLLALCTHHYSSWESLFHKSVIKDISSKANFPVFVFHK
ncbi:universal stress protein [soil metagenome]